MKKYYLFGNAKTTFFLVYLFGDIFKIISMDSRTIRYKNVRYLVDFIGGVTNFADKINKSQSQASQFSGSNPIKGIGNKVAREIESAFGKDHGWLDAAHPELWEDFNIPDKQLQNQNEQIQAQWQSQCQTQLNNPELYVLANSFDKTLKRIDDLISEKKLTSEQLDVIHHVLSSNIDTANTLMDGFIKSDKGSLTKQTA